MSQLKQNVVPGSCDKVHELANSVVDQIAAGELVERPASVVKELVENSIDAGSTEITVSIENGGKSTIKVADNGEGMSHRDALLCSQRFATSKISSVEDLESIASLGFRGEALASISSVSRFKLSTATESDLGTVLHIEAGVRAEVRREQLSRGTTIEIKNLFFNVPARRKFLKTENTEAGAVTSLLKDISLGHPQIGFRLFVDGRQVVNYSVSEDFFSRSRAIKIAGKNPFIVNEKTPNGILGIEALLSQPLDAVSGANKLRLLINGRTVREKLLFAAIRNAYGNFLKPGKYPIGIVSLDVHPKEVDVNVHPQKSEVRFRDSRAVFAFVTEAIKSVLGQSSVGDSEGFAAGNTQNKEQVFQSFSFDERNLLHDKGAFRKERFANKSDISWVEEKTSVASSSEEASMPFESLLQTRFVGQIFNLYLLLEGRDTFYILDMHAAHERVMFYKLKEGMLKDKSLPSQLLLQPEVIEIPKEQMEHYLVAKESLARLGFLSEQFGDDAIVVRGVPSLLCGVSVVQFFRELQALGEWSDWAGETQKLIERAISTMACHGSVRSGRNLKEAEVRELIRSLEEAEGSSMCPHGRPVLKCFTEQELEKLFGRVQF